MVDLLDLIAGIAELLGLFKEFLKKTKTIRVK